MIILDIIGFVDDSPVNHGLYDFFYIRHPITVPVHQCVHYNLESLYLVHVVKFIL